MGDTNMTILEAIGCVDALVPNSYTQQEKIRWLSTLDGKAVSEVFRTHEGGEGAAFEGYSPETEPDTVLLVPAPYDNIYPLYLEMQINYYYGETAKYNNAANAFEAAWTDFVSQYNRTHMPVQHSRKFW